MRAVTPTKFTAGWAESRCAIGTRGEETRELQTKSQQAGLKGGELMHAGKEDRVPGPDTDPQSGAAVKARGGILVIDDEAPIREVLREVLESVDYTVHTACDGVEGVAVFRHSHRAIDAVILDMVMPGMGGRETFEVLRTIDPEIPVLVCTAYSDNADLQVMRQQGISGILQKPVRVAVLRSALAAMISARGQKRTS